MPSLDVFNSNAFSLRSLTQAVERVPYLPMFLGNLGVFTPNPIRTETAFIEERNGVLTVVQTDNVRATGLAADYAAALLSYKGKVAQLEGEPA